LTAENQIITADPEVTVHDIMEEDEFLVIASDGAFHRSSSCPLPHATGQVSGTACPHNKLWISFD
jgi:hypothetical protein